MLLGNFVFTTLCCIITKKGKIIINIKEKLFEEDLLIQVEAEVQISQMLTVFIETDVEIPNPTNDGLKTNKLNF